MAVALATGFLCGYALLTPRDEWIPSRHWHWLPVLAIASAILGPVGFARGVSKVERLLLVAILAFASACLVVPNWEPLQPIRHRYVVFLTTYLFILAAATPPLVDRLPGKLILWILPVTSLVLGFTILACLSLRFGQLTGLLAGATLGSCLSGIWYERRAVHGLLSPFSILAGSLAFIAYIEPEQPLTGMLIFPASPLVLWFTTFLPVSQDRWLPCLLHGLAVALVLGAGIAWVATAAP